VLSFFKKKTRPRETEPAPDGALFDEEFQRRIEYLAIVARRVYAGRMRAERRSKRTGSGIEFADHREYAVGDDFRSLDVSVYQRTGKLLVRLFEEEEDLSVYVLLDSSASMGVGTPTKLRYGKQLAAALAYVALAHLDRVSVLSFAEGMNARLPPTRGKNRIFRLFEFLTPLRADGRTGLSEAMRAFAAQNKRRGVAIVISDLYDPAGFEDGINQLRFARFETHVLHLFDERELTPELYGDVQLVDHETGESRDVTITRAVLDRYLAAHADYRRRIEEFCHEKQVAYHAVDTSVPFDEVVLRMLRQGGTLG
jgi:uncharacterized protein (DUF58 family)